ncbi:MAG: hypothetical protein AB1861_06125 [Cyanobacteriota bacterium]
MKKKRPQQQATPPTKELKIVAVKRSPKPIEPPQEQPASVLTEKPVVDAASAPEPVAPTPVDKPAHTSSASSASSPESDARCSSPKSAPEPVPDKTASSPEQREQGEKTSSASSDSPDSPDSPSDQEVCFQAVGVIKGDITFSEDKTLVTIGGKQYELYYAGNHKRAYDALKKEIENTGITQQRLIVYPKITHYPGGKQPYRLGFQLAGFVGHEATGEGITSELEDLEFKISGLWQFIPVCRVPCISVFKNFNKQRLEYIKSAPVDKKVNFMKASHIPVMWRDAPVPPFRFNPKLDKETQGKASFVQIKARFNSARDNFEFVSLLGMPREEPPNYLKAGKKDKAEAVKAKRAAKAQERPSLPVPDNDAAPTPSDTTSKPKPKPKPKVVAAQQQ